MNKQRLIARLMEEGDPNAEVGFATAPDSDLDVLSIYVDDKGKVWVDLGEAA